jgi:hypothetical protein
MINAELLMRGCELQLMLLTTGLHSSGKVSPWHHLPGVLVLKVTDLQYDHERHSTMKGGMLYLDSIEGACTAFLEPVLGCWASLVFDGEEGGFAVKETKKCLRQKVHTHTSHL